MPRVFLELPRLVHRSLVRHLLPRRTRLEEAAFVFARATKRRRDTVFEYVEHREVPREGFVSRHGGYLELEDSFRASLIKRAHDLAASLAEFHSHPTVSPAAFSLSDRVGFEEFVPHIQWRLQGKPYLAVVVSRSGFDALVWLSDPRTPIHMDGLLIDEKVLAPTRLTLSQWRQFDERSAIRPQHPFLWQ